MNDRQSLLVAAEEVLSKAFRGAVRLEQSESLDNSGRSSVARCGVIDGPSGMPATVIAKRVRTNDNESYDSHDMTPRSAAWRLINEWTGLEFLGRVSGNPIAPRCYGGDLEVGIIVLEDLGKIESVADILLGSDPQRAETALVAFAATLGRMHGTTVARFEEYQALCRELGLAVPDATSIGRGFGDNALRFRGSCESLGIHPPLEFDDDMQAVQAAIEEPGSFLAYTHRDPCPDNNHYSGGAFRLFDFEFGGFRHALLDGAYGRVPFPTCWCVNRLPPQMPPLMEAAYRSELAKGCPEAADEALFNRVLVEACAFWLITNTSGLLPPALEQDQQWGISTFRQRVLFRLDAFADTSNEFGHLGALGSTARELAVLLRDTWPELEDMPLYPAFR